MSKKVPVSDLPIMPVCCKTCPFKQNERGVFQDNKLASKVIERTLFKSQQLCHKDAYLSKISLDVKVVGITILRFIVDWGLVN